MVPSMMFDLTDLAPRISQPMEPFQMDQWDLCELLYVLLKFATAYLSFAFAYFGDRLNYPQDRS